MFHGKDDYISLIDIAKYKNPEVSADIIKNWLRNRSTIEFLGLRERMNNPNFKLVEFHQFINESGANGFTFPHLLGNSVSLLN
ncbi:KilA-N domain-containing protein [Clostridium tyrobutyricum]|uniref:KilA-N domain-containing protein n=2 Tax=Clostridium tyrobutyricum TaxID=1519 RepID=UPI002B209F1C|nr:KilA-N domain-containing protein [Clostridium tyrobutyricum]MEA5008715.1 KilA-N domain-containing protein [Clostridium tyrobutyricum]